MAFTIYILECADGSYYTGITRRPVEQRVWEHNAGWRSCAVPQATSYLREARCRWSWEIKPRIQKSVTPIITKLAPRSIPSLDG